MAARLRSGIIGTGFIGEVHARAVRAAGGVVGAVLGSTPENSARAATRLYADRAASTVDELVDAVDVVHVCTPNHLHVEQALAAIAAGKHVICEKPLAMGLDAARLLATRAREAGVVAAVPFVYRYYPTVREARARVASGSVGPVRVVHGSYLQDWLADPAAGNWRVDARLGGVSRAFGDIGVHWCDLVEFTTGHRITTLSARLMTTPRHAAPGTVDGGTPTEDVAVLQFGTDGGALGSAVISQVSWGRKNRLWFSVDAATATLAFDQELPDSLWIGGPEGNLVVPRGVPGTSAQARRLDVVPAGHPQGYQDCFTGFVGDVFDAVRGEAPPGLPTFDDGVRAAALTESVLGSATSGAWVEVL